MFVLDPIPLIKQADINKQVDAISTALGGVMNMLQDLKQQEQTPQKKVKVDDKMVSQVKKQLSNNRYKDQDTGNDIGFNTAYNRSHPKAHQDFQQAIEKAKGEQQQEIDTKSKGKKEDSGNGDSKKEKKQLPKPKPIHELDKKQFVNHAKKILKTIRGHDLSKAKTQLEAIAQGSERGTIDALISLLVQPEFQNLLGTNKSKSVSTPQLKGSKPPSQPTPQGSQPIPQGTQPTPQGTQPTPQGNQPIPQGTQPIPQGTQPTPQGTQPIPQGNQPTPQGTQTTQTSQGTQPQPIQPPKPIQPQKPAQPPKPKEPLRTPVTIDRINSVLQNEPAYAYLTGGGGFGVKQENLGDLHLTDDGFKKMTNNYKTEFDKVLKATKGTKISDDALKMVRQYKDVDISTLSPEEMGKALVYKAIGENNLYNPTSSLPKYTPDLNLENVSANEKKKYSRLNPEERFEMRIKLEDAINKLPANHPDRKVLEAGYDGLMQSVLLDSQGEEQRKYFDLNSSSTIPLSSDDMKKQKESRDKHKADIKTKYEKSNADVLKVTNKVLSEFKKNNVKSDLVTKFEDFEKKSIENLSAQDRVEYEKVVGDLIQQHQENLKNSVSKAQSVVDGNMQIAQSQLRKIRDFQKRGLETLPPNEQAEYDEYVEKYQEHLKKVDDLNALKKEKNHVEKLQQKHGALKDEHLMYEYEDSILPTLMQQKRNLAKKLHENTDVNDPDRIEMQKQMTSVLESIKQEEKNYEDLVEKNKKPLVGGPRFMPHPSLIKWVKESQDPSLAHAISEISKLHTSSGYKEQVGKLIGSMKPKQIQALLEESPLEDFSKMIDPDYCPDSDRGYGSSGDFTCQNPLSDSNREKIKQHLIDLMSATMVYENAYGAKKQNPYGDDDDDDDDDFGFSKKTPFGQQKTSPKEDLEDIEEGTDMYLKEIHRNGIGAIDNIVKKIKTQIAQGLHIDANKDKGLLWSAIMQIQDEDKRNQYLQKLEELAISRDIVYQRGYR